MIKVFAIVLIFSIATTLAFLLTDDEELYPDLRCHDGFNRSERAHEILYNAKEACKTEYAKNANCALRCFKSCIVIVLKIIVGVQFVPESLLARGFKEFMFEGQNDAAGEQIAKNLVTNCSEILKDLALRQLPCDDEEYQKLYNCFERAWACQDSVPQLFPDDLDKDNGCF